MIVDNNLGGCHGICPYVECGPGWTSARLLLEKRQGLRHLPWGGQGRLVLTLRIVVVVVVVVVVMGLGKAGFGNEQHWKDKPIMEEKESGRARN